MNELMNELLAAKKELAEELEETEKVSFEEKLEAEVAAFKVARAEQLGAEQAEQLAILKSNLAALDRVIARVEAKAVAEIQPEPVEAVEVVEAEKAE